MQYGIDTYVFLFFGVTALTTIIYSMRPYRKAGCSGVPIAASMFLVFMTYVLLKQYGMSNYYSVLLLELSIAMASTMLAMTYITRPAMFSFLFVLLAFGILLFSMVYPQTTLFAGIFGIGTSAGLLYREGTRKIEDTAKRRNVKEVVRDFVHILLGVVLLGILAIAAFQVAKVVIFFLALFGYFVNGILGKGTKHRLLKFERENTTYGIGAMYLAIGVSLMLGFINSPDVLLFGIIALLFADPMATITGIMLKGPRLPYNKSKSVIGTLTIFVVAAFVGFFLIGLYALPFAAVLALVESVDVFLDDNIRIGVTVVILQAITGL